MAAVCIVPFNNLVARTSKSFCLEQILLKLDAQILIKREAHDIKKRGKEGNRKKSKSHLLDLIQRLFQTIVNYMLSEF